MSDGYWKNYELVGFSEDYEAASKAAHEMIRFNVTRNSFIKIINMKTQEVQTESEVK
jgi:hypothetical protein